MTEPKTMYVVTSDCYSSYGIVAIFDDRALADKCCDGSDDSSGYGMRVEEYQLNPHEADMRAGLKAHHVVMDRDGGIVSHSESWGDDANEGKVDYSLQWGLVGRHGVPIYRFSATVIAATREQAIKATNERRARWLAEGKRWPTDGTPYRSDEEIDG